MGLLFTPKLSWTAAKTKLAGQARKAIYAIKHFQKSFGRFQHYEMFKLFDVMVVPILTFGAEVWGFDYCETIEQVQIQFCKEYLGVNSSVNNVVALGECGRLPLCTNYHMKCVHYWCKLLQMSNHRYPKNCYLMLKGLDDVGRRSWASNVRELLFKYGFGFVWVSQDIGDIPTFLQQFKQRLFDCMFQNWQSGITDSTRCDFYKNIKTLLNPERYLSIKLPFNIMKSYARFRCSSHKLNIETGRHFNISRNDRICLYCMMQNDLFTVEDEYHAFFHCVKYVDIRRNLLHNWYIGRTELVDFYNLMKSDDPITIHRLAVFIYNILKLRDYDRVL